MKYEELEFVKVNNEDVEIIRYGANKVMNTMANCLYAYNDIDKVIINNNVYLRDKEEVNIPYLSDRLLNCVCFFDIELGEKVSCFSFLNENGEVQYGFTNHND